jgi:hypothetical protein
MDNIEDIIFRKMTVRWGRRFLGIWEGVDLLEVKADWAHELRNMPHENIAHGLTHLPDAPCTVGEFKRLCHTMPPPVFKALPAPPADKKIVEASLKKIRDILKK